MQELTAAPQMASPYTPAGGSNMPTTAPQQPKLGTPIPGTTGGLPAKPGLSVFDNPLSQPLQSQPQTPDAQAQQLQNYGRGEDTMLVHMTPGEVNSLQGLALASGGSLTINPHTGLPEAGWLGKLLPTLLGGALTFIPGIGPLAAAGIVGAGQTALTGDLRKGLMAGLGAYGGASLAGAIAPTAAGGAAGKLVAQSAAEKAMVGDLTKQLGAAGIDTGVKNAAGVTLQNALKSQVTNAGALSRFGAEAAMGTKGLLAKGLPMLAGSSVLGAISDASQPNMPKYDPNAKDENSWKYEGPYRPIQRKWEPHYQEGQTEGEISFFNETNPVGYLTSSGQMRGYAEGGEAKKEPTKPSMTSADWYKQWDVDAPITQQWGKLVDTYKTRPLSADEQAELTRLTPLVDAISERRRIGYTELPTAGLGAITPPTTPPTTPPGVTDSWAPRGVDFPITEPVEDKVSVDTLNTTISPTMGGVTAGSGTGATLGDRTLSEGATQSGDGLEVLKETYTPKFTQVEDFVSEKAAPYTLGSELFAQLPAATERYNTSPGAITAMNGYAGGSPSERIRAAARANAAARAAAAQRATTGATAGTTTANTATPFNFDAFLGGFGSGAGSTANVANTANTAGTFQNNAMLGGDTDFGGEMNYGFTPSAGALDGTTNPATNAASLIGTDEFWNALAQNYGGGYRDVQNVNEFARGGHVDMRDGSFVVDARTVSELGNGSSNAGMELLARLGGRPLRGPGDGVSDSIPARIGGKQEARVARDEVIMPPEAVRRIGKGSEKRGTEKLYALMDKAHKARKKAKRGQDTKIAKGLGALA